MAHELGSKWIYGNELGRQEVQLAWGYSPWLGQNGIAN